MIDDPRVNLGREITWMVGVYKFDYCGANRIGLRDIPVNPEYSQLDALQTIAWFSPGVVLSATARQ
jgi:hypothetical protein